MKVEILKATDTFTDTNKKEAEHSRLAAITTPSQTTMPSSVSSKCGTPGWERKSGWGRFFFFFEREPLGREIAQLHKDNYPVRVHLVLPFRYQWPNRKEVIYWPYRSLWSETIQLDSIYAVSPFNFLLHLTNFVLVTYPWTAAYLVLLCNCFFRPTPLPCLVSLLNCRMTWCEVV